MAVWDIEWATQTDQHRVGDLVNLEDPKLTQQLVSFGIDACGQVFNLRHRQTGDTRRIEVHFHVAPGQWPPEGMVNDVLRGITVQKDPPAVVHGAT